MNELLALVAGAALGALFFGGLWWTVRRMATSPQPALWMLGSLLLRMGAVLAGFVAVAGGHWERLLMCLLGFVGVRLVAVRRVRRTPPQGAGHAPQS